MNLKKISLLLAATALCSASAFAAATSLTTPAISPAAGTYFGNATTPFVVTITPATLPTGVTAHCYYTIDGTTPTTATLTTCDSVTTVNIVDAAGSTHGEANKVTVQAIELMTATTAYKSSAAAKTAFVVENQITAPVLTPAHTAGPANVQITDAWSDTIAATGKTILPTIYYTTGTTPCSATGTKYVAKTPIAVTAETTINACAIASGYEQSNTTTGVYDDGVGSGLNLVVAAGSSAQFNEFALAAGGPLGEGTGAICGAHHFTKKNAVQIADVRSGVTPADTGHLSLVWNHCADPLDAKCDGLAPTTICAFANLDSTLGVKAFMISNLTVPGGFINITSSTTPGNMLAPFWANATGTADEAMIPADVLKAINGQPFNAAVTDIRPEDAKFATTRALGKLNAARTGLGYGPAPIGSPIKEWSGSGSSTFNVVDFALSGFDPITGSAQKPYTTITVGAAPVVVFVNTQAGASSSSSFHFSDPSVTNIGRFTLAGYLNGSITNTSALATSAVTGNPVHVFLREPLSGTYNTMEFNVPASKEIASSQEIGVDPSVNTLTGADANGNMGNPLNITVVNAACPTCKLGTFNSAFQMEGLAGATRQRAIGTGDMVKVVARMVDASGITANAAAVKNSAGVITTPASTCTYAESLGVVSQSSAAGTCFDANGDAIGYAFWGYGNFSFGNNVAPLTTKYLTVDGVDPLYSAANPNTNGAGVFPVCDSSNFNYLGGKCPAVPFDNIMNGSYPIWTMYRVVTSSPAPALVAALVAQAQDNSVVGVVRDFVPANSMKVFRSHYLQAGVAGSDGFATGTTEAGGDVGGAVYTVQQDLNHFNEYGSEITGLKQ